MDKTALVNEDIEAGRKLFEILKAAKTVRVEAAFWWWDDDRWRFIVATPVVHEKGRLVAHDRIEATVSDAIPEVRSILEHVDVRSPSEGIITVLDVGSHGKAPLNRLVKRESVRGAYVPGAYFYYFSPKTFIAA